MYAQKASISPSFIAFTESITESTLFAAICSIRFCHGNMPRRNAST